MVMKYIYRQHRGGLKESLETQVSFDNADIIGFLKYIDQYFEDNIIARIERVWLVPYVPVGNPKLPTNWAYEDLLMARIREFNGKVYDAPMGMFCAFEASETQEEVSERATAIRKIVNQTFEKSYTKTVYIHHGSEIFDEERFTPISNKSFSKPSGGLWASPLNADFPWIKWVEQNMPRWKEEKCSNFFKFTLKDEARILVIADIEQTKNLPIYISEEGDVLDFEQIYDNNKIKPEFKNVPYSQLPTKKEKVRIVFDWEAIAENYDAVELEYTCDWNMTNVFWGWDCDSILILNKEMIEVI